MKLSKEQLSVLKKAIDKHLELRCINVETKLEYNEDNDRFALTSTNFQTVPVLHTNLSIINFGGGIGQDKKDKDRFNIWLSVYVTYDGNGTGLFEVKGAVRKNKENLWITNVSHGDRF